MQKFVRAGAVLLITGILFRTELKAQGPRLRFTHLSGEQGLSNSTIETITQDDRGFIWIGTRDGLNRYDGHDIQIYRNDPADTNTISDSYIRCIYEDRAKKLWIGTINGLNLLDPATGHFARWKHHEGESNSLSNSTISSILEDKAGRLWIGTGHGLNLLDRKTSRLSHFGEERIFCILEDNNGSIWVGTQNGLTLFHPETGKFTTLVNPAITNPSGNAILSLQTDRQGNIWAGTENDGIFLYDRLQQTFTRYGHSDKTPQSLGDNMVKCMLTDHKGQLWAGGINGGLNLFHAASGGFYHYSYEPGNGNSLSQRTISALYEDRQGNLWVGTHRGGINIYSPDLDKFNLYRPEPTGNSLSYNDVKTFCEDKSGDIWIGTDGGGLNLFSRSEQIFRSYHYDPYNNKSLGSNAVLDVMQDREGEVWVSTWGGGLNLLDRKTGSFTRFVNNPADSHSISSNCVQKTFEDYAGNIWVATYYGGLNIFDRKTKLFTRGLTDPTGATRLTGKNIVSLLEDKDGRIWIGTDDEGLNCYNPSTRHFTHYFNQQERRPDLRVLFTDSKGRIWVGQKGLYLWDAAKDSFRLFTDKGGLSNEFIKGITEDDQYHLWIATSNGLTQLNPENGVFTKYNTADGLQDLEFEANAYLKTRDGEMFFGGINGFNCWYPAAIKQNSFVPPVVITGFQLSNRPMLPGVNGSPLHEDISLTPEIRLSYRQSTFSFTFAALNYTIPQNNRYAYMLDGLDKDWNDVGKDNKAVYTNLDPGEYVFRVRGSNNDGVWNEKGASIRVIITPPFWRTGWFIGLLFLLGMAGLYWFYKIRTRNKLREMDASKREEMRQMQLQFFTNISHEFRTPLSLILGPLEKMMKQDAQPGFQRHFQTMHRNAQRLLSLINELMDFGKLESGALKLSVQRGNLGSFMEEIAEEFRDWAMQKDIGFTLRQQPISGETWFDRQLLEKIVLNLLHNSFKYTKVGGHITLEVLPSLEAFKPSFENELIIRNEYKGQEYAYIRVADSGIGISASSIQHLFERYYRITDSHLGSGVGLAFVKSLALLHKGDILVYSQRLKGTEILIGIPIREGDYTKEEKRGAIGEGAVRLEGRPQPGWKEEEETEESEEHSKNQIPVELILLVEDNDELRHFLKDSLSEHYQVIEAADGREGLTLAQEMTPTLIISDVIMPGMNGFELCREIKKDIDTSHIPFVMLTARGAPAAQAEGLDAGADYYFAKPLNTELLLLTIRNRLEQDRKLKDRYLRDSQVEAMELAHSEKDKEFMNKLLQIIDQHLPDPDFDIEQLCQQMGMSRTRLYQKIKGLSKQSIGDFIRGLRLKKAVHIMTHEDVTLTEVMVRVGIQTQSYFTRAFKKEFGKTPTQYMQEIKKI